MQASILSRRLTKNGYEDKGFKNKTNIQQSFHPLGITNSTLKICSFCLCWDRVCFYHIYTRHGFAERFCQYDLVRN